MSSKTNLGASKKIKTTYFYEEMEKGHLEQKRRPAGTEDLQESLFG